MLCAVHKLSLRELCRQLVKFSPVSSPALSTKVRGTVKIKECRKRTVMILPECHQSVAVSLK